MNASVAIVIVADEKNITLSWTTTYPPVLLTDELAVSNDQTDEKCNNFGRVATRGTSPQSSGCFIEVEFLVYFFSF